MSRWTKNMVVPLDSLIKEKENTNRPTAARSAGTVGKWGKMGFTSTRTYGLQSLPTSLSPGQSPDMGTSGEPATSPINNEPSKPKKFFKSRNAPVDFSRVTQIIQQHLPKEPSSPMLSHVDDQNQYNEHTKIPKTVTNRKKRLIIESSKKEKKKEKLKKKIRPESMPSRVTSRNRKIVNYNEDDNYEKKYVEGKVSVVTLSSEPIETLRPPIGTPSRQTDHPPIVLRISKGTSRLISTDSEDLPLSSPQHDVIKSPLGATQTSKPFESTERSILTFSEANEINTPSQMYAGDDLNFSTANISLDKPPKERLKLIIKTDVIRNALTGSVNSESSILKNEKVMTKKQNKFKCFTSTQSIGEQDKKQTSPQPISEKDFDSQSSILGSNSTKSSLIPLNITEESCLIRSRGSSDITSDLETSQHSSLVAPPSDIELRLELMDGEDDNDQNSQSIINRIEEPLQEDILKVLTGDIDTSYNMNNIQIENKEKEYKTYSSPTMQTTRRGKSNNIKEGKLIEEGIDSSIRRSSRRLTTRLIDLPESINKIDDIVIKSPKEDSNRPDNNLNENQNEYNENNDINDQLSVSEPVTTRIGRITRNNNNKDFFETTNRDQMTAPQSNIRTNTRKQKDRVSETKTSAHENPIIDQTNADDLSPLKPTTDLGEAKRDSANVSSESTNVDTSPREYKIKNKFKRTWLERDAKDQLEAAAARAQINVKSSKSKDNNCSNDNNTEIYSHLKLDSPTGNDTQRSVVKLVISKKKGSIFKSRAVTDRSENTTKKRHVYKHTWDADEEKPIMPAVGNKAGPSNRTQTCIFDEFNEDNEVENPLQKVIPKLTRVTKVNNSKYDPEAITSVKCDKNAKEYYTVVRNVKTAHQIQEIGEFQEMDDDIEYILDALQPHNPIHTRCLSALQLASKCMTPAFRMHVRAHGTVTKFFRALRDSRTDSSLSLCTATIMFVLSHDALNMDLDRDSLELMMNLLEDDPSKSMDMANFERSKFKVRELCEEIKSQGKASYLNIDSISSSTLAMETLLSLTSKRAGEWFKEELRELGGLEYIINTICECCHQITDYVVSWSDPLLDKLRTIERCLRVLENVSQLNEKNQHYILYYGNGSAVDTLFKLYKLCDCEIALYPTTDLTPKDNPGVVLREALLPTIKVLINLTHPFNSNAVGSTLLGQREGIFDTSLHILLQAPNYIPDRCVFDLSLLVLLLLINLTMYTVPNRTLIMQSHAPSDFGNQYDKVPAIKALIEYFYKCEEYARLAEQNTDALLDKADKSNKKQEEVDESVNNILQKAGHHMEHTLKGSYTGILIGHLISENDDNEIIIRSYLRNQNFADIIKMLHAYYNFMNLTASSEATVVSHIKATRKIIDLFKQCDAAEVHSNIPNEDEISSSTSTAASTTSTRNNRRVYKTYSQR